MCSLLSLVAATERNVWQLTHLGGQPAIKAQAQPPRSFEAATCNTSDRKQSCQPRKTHQRVAAVTRAPRVGPALLRNPENLSESPSTGKLIQPVKLYGQVLFCCGTVLANRRQMSARRASALVRGVRALRSRWTWWSVEI